MKLTAKDSGNYLRGMLLLIGKDQKILEQEKNWFFSLSKILGYDLAFCKTAIKELPENEYLQTSPPVFSNPEIAKAFIIDGIHLAYADKEINPNEIFWINTVAEANGIDILWGMNEYEKFRHMGYSEDEVYTFAIGKLVDDLQ